MLSNDYSKGTKLGRSLEFVYSGPWKRCRSPFETRRFVCVAQTRAILGVASHLSLILIEQEGVESSKTTKNRYDAADSLHKTIEDGAPSIALANQQIYSL